MIINVCGSFSLIGAILKYFQRWQKALASRPAIRRAMMQGGDEDDEEESSDLEA